MRFDIIKPGPKNQKIPNLPITNHRNSYPPSKYPVRNFVFIYRDDTLLDDRVPIFSYVGGLPMHVPIDPFKLGEVY